MADPQVDQKLAAILAADVAGYSRLMEADERATVATLEAYRAVFQAAFAAVTNSFGEPGANAMAFCSWQQLSRQRPSRRLSCRPPLWLGGGLSGSRYVLLSPAARFPFQSGPACTFSGLRQTFLRLLISLTSTFR